MWQTPNCATAATASPTRYERTLRNCARALSDFAGCTEPGASWDEERFREWAREHRAEASKQAGWFVARLLRDKWLHGRRTASRSSKVC